MLAFAPSPEDITWLLLLFLIVPITWIAGLIFFASRPRNMAIWTALVGTFYFAFFIASRTGFYTLTVQFLDPSRQPIAGLNVSYFTHSQSDRFGRFSPSLKGQITTDSAGRLTLRPNHAHGIGFNVRDPRFHNGHFHLDAAGRRHGHQIFPSTSVTFVEPAEPPPLTGPFHGTWTLAARPQHRLVVALKPK